MNLFDFFDAVKAYPVESFKNDLALSLDNDKDALQLQIKQWDEGVDENGKVLGYYTKATEILSGGRKKQGDRFNLFDTGDFRQHTYLFTTEKNNDLIFDYDSSGSNTSKLLARIGPTIFGLQPQNKEKFTELATEKAIQLLNTNFKLK